MKIKKGKMIWLIIDGILLLIMLIGTVGTLIKYGDFQLINLVIIFLASSDTFKVFTSSPILIFLLVERGFNYIEKK